MPRIPVTNNVVPIQPQVPMPSPTELAMAAAAMHQEGRLFEQPKPKATNDSRK